MKQPTALLTALTLLLIAGCSSPPAKKPVLDTAVPAGDPVPPGMTEADFGSGHGRLVPGVRLLLSVEVAGQFEVLDHGFTVGADGTTVLPLVDEVLLGGQTLKQASAILTQKYQPFFVAKPHVMLQLAEGQDAAIWGHVTVLGRVVKPGRILLPATRMISLSDAIGRAGGFDTSAKSGAVQVTLHQPGGATRKRTVDLEAIGRGKVDDVLLHTGDVVFVPERFF